MHAPIGSVLTLCETSRQIRKICQNEFFWGDRLILDYPTFAALKPIELSWQQAYLDLIHNKVKQVPLYVGDRLLTTIWLSREISYQELYNLLQEVYNLLTPLEERLPFTLIEAELAAPPLILHVVPVEDLITDQISDYPGSLWDNIVNFRIGQGRHFMIPPRRADEPPTVFVRGPGGPFMIHY